MFGILWNGQIVRVKRRDPEPRRGLDFTGGPVADLTLHGTTDSGHPTTRNVRTTIATLKPRCDRQTGNKRKNARRAMIEGKKGGLRVPRSGVALHEMLIRRHRVSPASPTSFPCSHRVFVRFLLSTLVQPFLGLFGQPPQTY